MFLAVHYLDQCGSDLAATYLDDMGLFYTHSLANMTYLAMQRTITSGPLASRNC